MVIAKLINSLQNKKYVYVQYIRICILLRRTILSYMNYSNLTNNNRGLHYYFIKRHIVKYEACAIRL